VSEQKPATSKLLFTLIGALVIAVGVQAWYVAGMHQKLSAMQASKPQVSSPLGSENPRSPQSPGKSQNPTVPAPPGDDWFNRPFDPDSWDPLQEMQQMQDRMNQIFGDSLGRFGRSSRFGDLPSSNRFSPNIDVKEEDDRFVIHADLPGAQTSNIEVKLEGQTLTITGTTDQKQEDTDDQGQVLRRERRSGRFSRTITLPSPVKNEGMEDHIHNGVLEITIPKKSADSKP